MKLFACRNTDCPSNVPNDAVTNNIKEMILAKNPLDETGNIPEESDPQVVEVYYICDNCKSRADQVPNDEVLDVEFMGREGDYIYGLFRNPLRRNEPFDCRVVLDDLSVEVKGFEPRDVEIEYVISQFQREYKDRIRAEVVHVEKDRNGTKTYEVLVENPIEDNTETVYIKDGEIADDEHLNKYERQKALISVRRSVY